MSPTARLASPVAAAVLLLAGCGAPPGLTDQPGSQLPTPAPTTSAPPPLPDPVQPGGPGSPIDGEYPTEIAISCLVGSASPEVDELLALLRSDGMLAADTEAELIEGPLCSGSWQYAVWRVPDRDPLQVVTRGQPGELELVTAGTDVCSVEVRFLAPQGIRGIAACLD